MMGSEWHPRRHPQPDQNHYTQRSLPSFAELTSSSTDSLHRTRDSVPPPPLSLPPPPTQLPPPPPPPPPHTLPAVNIVDRPVSRSSPPKSIASADFPNPSLAADRAAFTPINHASPHVSPTNTRAPPVVPQHQTYSHSHSLPHTTAAAPYSPPLSSGPLPALHETAPSQTPTVNARQDSAIAQQPYDHPKDAESSLPSSVFAFSYFHPPVGNRRQSASRPGSHPVGPSSPHSPGETRAHQSQPPPETGAHGLRNLHPPTQSPGTQFASEPTRSPPHPRGPPAAATTANPDSGLRNPLPSPTLDQTNGTGRHQRYNVRFNTVYTSENMPPNQKPKNDPAPTTVPPPAEPAEEQKSPSEQTVRPSVEPVTPSAMLRAPSPDEQPPTQQQQTVPQLERCKGCGEPWRRPLPGEDQYRLSSPAQNMGEQLALTQDFIKRLENHAKFADEAYNNWRRKHQWCVAPQQQQPASPPATEPPTETRNKSEEGQSPAEAPAPQTNSAKRKSEIPHEASKFRKVANFEPQSNATQPVRPTAPA